MAGRASTTSVFILQDACDYGGAKLNNGLLLHPQIPREQLGNS